MRRFFNPVTVILIVVMAYSSISSGRFSSPMDWLMSTMLLLPGILIALSFHEFAHAIVAYKLGDQLPKVQGRLTISPISHMDPLGFICLLFIGFGWGKPVMINPNAFKNPRRDELLVSIAGVTMNLLLAIVFTAILALYDKLAPAFAMTYMGDVIAQIILYTIQINIVLMIFNLLPIPPLDGFNVITGIFNLKHTELYYKVYQNGFIILMLLLIFDIIDVIFRYTVDPIFMLLLSIFF